MKSRYYPFVATLLKQQRPCRGSKAHRGDETQHAASLQRLLVPLVLRVLPLGGIELGDTGGVGFLYLAPDDLHGAIYHAVLLGERLGEDGEGGRQPTIREHTRQVASLAETVDLALDDTDGLFSALIAREVQILVGQMFPQPFFVRDQQGGRVRTLVIVQDQLVDARGMLYQGFLYTLRTVFLPVASDQQALETPQHIKKPVTHISHIPVYSQPSFTVSAVDAGFFQ